MRTQRFRTSTLPAIRRTLRRVVTQRRLPRHIVPNIRAAIRRRLTAVTKFVRRWSLAGRRARNLAGPGGEAVPTSRGWRVAPVTEAISASEIAASHLSEVMAVLTTAGVEPFVTEPRGSIRYRIGVFEERRTAALAALRASPFDMGNLVARGEVEKRTGSTPSRIAVWRHHHLGKGVTTGEELGLDVEFWRNESIGRVVPDGRRGLASFFPDPEPGATIRFRDRPYPTHSTFAADVATRQIQFPIDIVYTWVDGSDPIWQADYVEHLRKAEGLHREAANVSRYANRDELRYSMRSLWWYADFFQHVYLVTAGHLPDWIDTSHPKLTVVTHRELFSDDELPTFNSHAIETRLHHIANLAEHYLYMNDDMFFARPASPELFFSQNGIARMFPSNAPMPPGPATAADAPVDAAAKNGRELLAGALGFRPARKLRHTPYPQLRSVMAETEERFSTEVARTAANRFRAISDVSFAASLAQYYGYATGRVVVADIVTKYFNIADRWAPGQLATLVDDKNCDVFCLNETSMDDAHEDRVNTEVARFLERYFPKPSPFERQSSSEPPPV